LFETGVLDKAVLPFAKGFNFYPRKKAHLCDVLLVALI
jgi:hypothetical protein